MHEIVLVSINIIAGVSTNAAFRVKRPVVNLNCGGEEMTRTRLKRWRLCRDATALKGDRDGIHNDKKAIMPRRLGYRRLCPCRRAADAHVAGISISPEDVRVHRVIAMNLNARKDLDVIEDDVNGRMIRGDEAQVEWKLIDVSGDIAADRSSPTR